MIDRVIGYDEELGYEIYMSDVYPYQNYIGYENENGEIILYQNH